MFSVSLTTLAAVAISSVFLAGPAAAAVAHTTREVYDSTTDAHYGCKWIWENGIQTFHCPSPCKPKHLGPCSSYEDYHCPPVSAPPSGPQPSGQPGHGHGDQCWWGDDFLLHCPANCHFDIFFRWVCDKKTKRKVNPVSQFTFTPGYVSPDDHASRSALLCPTQMTACPLRHNSDVGSALSPNGSYECIDPMSFLDSCGGCATMGRGQDCNLIPGANAGCYSGECIVLSCKSGYEMQEGVCVKKAKKSKVAAANLL